MVNFVMDGYTFEHEIMKVDKYLQEKGLLLERYNQKEIQQLYLKEFLEWDDKAKMREKTGHKQGQYSIDIERRSRILYDKVLFRPTHKNIPFDWFDERIEKSRPQV